MTKATIQVMIITIISKFFGFVREMVLSYVYGAWATTDAYLVSQSIPVVVFSFVSAAIATGFILMYSRIYQERGREAADLYTSNLSSHVFSWRP